MKKIPSKANLLTNGDLDNIAELIEKHTAPLASKLDLQEGLQAAKQDLEQAKIEIKEYVHEAVETIMDGMDKLSEQLAEKKRVDALEQWAKKASEKIGVPLELFHP